MHGSNVLCPTKVCDVLTYCEDQELRCPSDGANMVEQVGSAGSHGVTG